MNKRITSNRLTNSSRKYRVLSIPGARQGYAEFFVVSNATGRTYAGPYTHTKAVRVAAELNQ